MKFGAVYCLYEDYEFLEMSLSSIKDKLDKIIFLVSDIPWNGKPSNNNDLLEKLNCLCKKNSNFELIKDHWANEVDQRNFALKYFYKNNFDYCFIIDSDEIYHDYHFENIKSFILKNPNISAFHIEWNTYWKKQYYVVYPRETFTPVIAVKVDSFQFTHIRQGITSILRTESFVFNTKERYNGILIPNNLAICFHLSYARTNERIERKLETSTHTKEFYKNWYDDVWLKWKPENKNLHPVTPSQYKQAIQENFLVFPNQLKKFIKKERFENNKCSIIILNWNSYNLLINCLNLILENTISFNEIIIIDNGSDNLPEDFVCLLKSNYNIDKVVLNKVNLGFAAGVNQGIKIANEENDICLLNVDAEPQKNWLSELYSTLINNDTCGIVGPLGNEIENGYQNENFVKEDTKVFNLHFYCVLILRDLINKIGFLDEVFGLGSYEDNDFCIRSMLAGYQCWISAKSLVRHKAHQVFKINNVDNKKLEEKNKVLLESKLIKAFYKMGSSIDLIFSLPELSRKCRLVIKNQDNE